MRYERSDIGLRGWRVLVDADEVRVTSGKTVPYPTWIGFIEESGKIHVWTPAAYVPRGYRAAAREMLEQAKAELLGSRDNPRRPPKQWMRDCVAGASKSAADPSAVCGALWYRKMSPAAKRAALARESRGDNPSDYMNWLRDVQRRVGAELARASERYLQGLFVSGESARSAAEKLRRSNPAWSKVFG